MQLNFPWTGIETLLEEIRSAKTVKPMYKRKTGKGFWLVGDQGVYLMANTSDGPLYKDRKDDERYFVVYAEECNPDKVPEWRDVKRASFGGDDGTEFISIEDIEKLKADPPQKNAKPHSLLMELTPEGYSMGMVWRLI